MERYKGGPNKASPYASWTSYTWSKHASQKILRNADVDTEDNDHPSDIDQLQSNIINTVIATEPEENDFEEVRKNVWSDVDDELYIANIIKERTTNEVKRVIRDTSWSVSDYSEVVSSVKLDKSDMWDLEPTDLKECDCLGPPPEFLLPPPPRPPFLQAEYYCGDDPIADLETCDTEPLMQKKQRQKSVNIKFNVDSNWNVASSSNDLDKAFEQVTRTHYLDFK
ncbi:unnamed protein product [Pieris macdunnoughi]|uniref:Uncharacterized protein n=1 Tax=Pieris macdunnoughi TaxID=345717 RepID=A0A821SYH9_9NEOP|nr:unnamed protein product [Pieris macdunnoughi]